MWVFCQFPLVGEVACPPTRIPIYTLPCCMCYSNMCYVPIWSISGWHIYICLLQVPSNFYWFHSPWMLDGPRPCALGLGFSSQARCCCWWLTWVIRTDKDSHRKWLVRRSSPNHVIPGLWMRYDWSIQWFLLIPGALFHSARFMILVRPLVVVQIICDRYRPGPYWCVECRSFGMMNYSSLTEYAHILTYTHTLVLSHIYI